MANINCINIRTNSVMDKILRKISPKYREDQLRKEAAMLRQEWNARVEHAQKENLAMMETIMKEKPAGETLLWIKFQGGTTGTGEQFRENCKEQKEYMLRHNTPWCYTRGTGLICVDPSKFKGPEDIAKILWEPSRFLKGGTIKMWWFEAKNS